LACLLEEEEEGGEKGEQQQGRASAGRFSAPCTGKKRVVRVGERRKKFVAARGVDANFPICKGESSYL
jgi:hypothetical protein